MMFLFRQFSGLAAGFALIVVMTVSNGGLINKAHAGDGNTPANEGVCDVLIGATPGLYGLCVGYCEARDINDIANEDSKPSNGKLLDLYNKRKKDSDPEMPCVQTPCSCWTAAELDVNTWGMRSSAPRCSVNEFGANATEGTFFAGQDRRDASAQDRGTDGFRCVYNEQLQGVSREFYISQDEYQVCYDQVAQLCTDLGL
jgi:hypothetical protein